MKGQGGGEVGGQAGGKGQGGGEVVGQAGVKGQVWGQVSGQVVDHRPVGQARRGVVVN